MPNELPDAIADGLQQWILHLAAQQPESSTGEEPSEDFREGWLAALQTMGDLIATLKVSGWATPPAATRLPHNNRDSQ